VTGPSRPSKIQLGVSWRARKYSDRHGLYSTRASALPAILLILSTLAVSRYRATLD
jgi:hypothetical protein